MSQKSPYKTHIGDGVYADFDGYHVVLTTDNGYQETNKIYLEPECMEAFKKYYDNLIKKLTDERNSKNNVEGL